MSWLSELARKVMGRDAYERAKRRVARQLVKWLYVEAGPQIAERLRKAGLRQDVAERVADEIVDVILEQVED